MAGGGAIGVGKFMRASYVFVRSPGSMEGSRDWVGVGVVLRMAGFGGVSGGGVASIFVCPEEGIGSCFGWYWLCSG